MQAHPPPMRRIWLTAIITLALTHTAHAASNPYVEALIIKAESGHLADTPAWHKILFYRGSEGIVDSPGFFMAETGKRDPHAEMTAALRSFFRSAADYSDPNLHPQCAFPRRYKWLRAQLGIDKDRLPDVNCPDRTKFLATLRVTRLSFVFSSYYLNSPASLFGHTFLRAHKDDGADDAGLLDHAINFAAQLKEQPGGFEYAYNGVTGGFPGRFAVTPYYIKVQEYNNHESRDLWEYELKLSADELENLFFSMWEWGPHQADYFYFSENCSFVLLMLLEATRTDLVLTERLHPWVMPIDTLHALTTTPGLIGEVHHRPSSWSRFEERMSRLSEDEQGLVTELVRGDAEPNKVLAGLTPVIQARIIDAALEFIDFLEKLAANLEARSFPQRRRALLVLRASLARPADSLVNIPRERQPDLSHDSNMYAVGAGGAIDDGAYVQFWWRPALHDTAERAIGYTHSSEIRVMDTEARVFFASKRLALDRFDLFAIRSVAPFSLLNRNKAWQLSTGYRTWSALPGAKDGEVYLRAGVGLAFGLVDKLTLFAMPTGDAAAKKEPIAGSLAVQFDCGAILELTPDVHLTYDATAQHSLLGSRDTVPTSRVQAVVALDRNRDIRFRSRARGRALVDGELSFGFFF